MLWKVRFLRRLSHEKKGKQMRTYQWWLGQKRRVQKKYTLFLGGYLSPKEVKEWLKWFKKAVRIEKKRAQNED